MNNNVNWDAVKELIVSASGSEEAVVNPDTKLMDDLEFDSVAVMELLSQIEEVFGVDFTDLDDFEERFNRCGDLYEGILELTEKLQLEKTE